MVMIIHRLISWFKNLFSSRVVDKPASRGESVMPRELISLVLEECDRHAMEYSDSRRQLPCTFSVFLSEEDFAFFYKANRDEVESEIVSALRSLAQQTGDRMKAPSVTLRIDSDLQKGECRVETSFEAVDAPPTPAVVVPAVAVVDDSAASTGHETPAMDVVDPGGFGHTPVLTAEPTITAQVIAADGSAFDVHDGDVIGIVRDLGRELPNIALHPSPDLEYCGQRHGQFVQTEEGGYAYQTLSRNGSVLMRNGTPYRVTVDDGLVELEDGDQLVLGKGNPAFTFSLREG